MTDHEIHLIGHSYTAPACRADMTVGLARRCVDPQDYAAVTCTGCMQAVADDPTLLHTKPRLIGGVPNTKEPEGKLIKFPGPKERKQ